MGIKKKECNSEYGLVHIEHLKVVKDCWMLEPDRLKCTFIASNAVMAKINIFRLKPNISWRCSGPQGRAGYIN